MGVLTSKEFENLKNKDAGVKSSASIIKKEKDMGQLIEQFILDSAPMGNSNVSFYHDGVPVQLKIKDKIYKLPANLKGSEKNNFKRILVKAGFKDISRYEGEPEKKPEKKKKVDMIYRLGHPDNAPDEPIADGKVAAMVDGKEILLDLKGGVVQTENEEAYTELLKQGFYEISKKEKSKSKKD